MGKLLEVKVCVLRDDDQKIIEITDDLGGEPTHDAFVNITARGADVCCDCQNKWLVTPRQGKQLDDLIIETFQAHVSYFHRQAIKPD